MKRMPLLGLLFFTLSACQQQKSDLDQATNIAGGRCYLRKTQAAFLCLNFNNGYDANTAQGTCNTEYDRYRTSSGVNGISWLSGNANTCPLATNATSVGACTRSDGVIYYYSDNWTAGNAQTDCTGTHNGTWSP